MNRCSDATCARSLFLFLVLFFSCFTHPRKSLDVKIHPLSSFEGKRWAWWVAFSTKEMKGELKDGGGEGLEGVDVGELEGRGRWPGGGGRRRRRRG